MLFVTPCIVNAPVTSYTSFLPLGLMLVLLNVISGYLSTSKKFAERRSLSRGATPVSIEAVLMVNSTDDSVGLLRSTLIEPATSLNLPLTRVIRWRIWNVASEWYLSTMNVSVAAKTAVDTKAARTKAKH